MRVIPLERPLPLAWTKREAAIPSAEDIPLVGRLPSCQAERETRRGCQAAALSNVAEALGVQLPCIGWCWGPAQALV